METLIVLDETSRTLPAQVAASLSLADLVNLAMRRYEAQIEGQVKATYEEIGKLSIQIAASLKDAFDAYLSQTQADLKRFCRALKPYYTRITPVGAAPLKIRAQFTAYDIIPIPYEAITHGPYVNWWQEFAAPALHQIWGKAAEDAKISIPPMTRSEYANEPPEWTVIISIGTKNSPAKSRYIPFVPRSMAIPEGLSGLIARRQALQDRLGALTRKEADLEKIIRATMTEYQLEKPGVSAKELVDQSYVALCKHKGISHE